ncbi:MAG: hypothetical protein ACRDY4_13750 [Acidimicrobiia bacterium]
MRNATSIRRLLTIAAGALAVGVAACTPLKPPPAQSTPSDPAPPAEAELSIDPTQADLGDNETQVFTITNIGDQDSGTVEVGFGAAEATISAVPCFTASDVSISADQCAFTVVADTCSEAVLGGGQSCTVDVQHPDDSNLEVAEAALRVSAVPGGQVTAELNEVV